MPPPLRLRPHLTLLNISLLSTSLGLAALSYPFLRAPYTTTSTMSHPPSFSKTTPSNYPTEPYTPRHKTFPYTKRDLTPSDASPDTDFYSSPRFVTHIDDHAIARLSQYYGTVLPTHGRILDVCTSWISHYPPATSQAVASGTLQVAGVGMSAAEMQRNAVLHGKWAVHDLNASPEIPALGELFGTPTSTSSSTPGEEQRLVDATTITVSIDYLTSPVSTLRSLLHNTTPNGTIHLAISNRCFPTKAVRRWLDIDEEERLQMVGDYLWFAGWREVEIVTVSDGKLEEGEGEVGGGEGGMAAFMRMLGGRGGRCDPLWVVRARKVEGG